MKNININLGEIKLDTLNPNDFKDYWEMIANDQVAKKTGFEPVKDESKAKMIFQSENEDHVTFVIRLVDSGKVIGLINLFPEIGENFEPVYDNLELGYFMNNNYQKRGYMTKALSAVLENFDEASLIEATVNQNNEPSMKVLNKLGFHQIDKYDGYKTFELKLS
ncbi:GNAT family N-acetyltransferase [Apilactobacillus micheneri]|uniref:GNAT family N-acetyltransferase n=1 Tax=Apilactobacillus micheneri TaxID=1899430 RepID=UPI000D02CC05|nr:GNAT family N-acetyltransferase [Apilactobacillus micheneri]TPR36975.1 N-acetyltransferase [Apilactobacillus micheneri]TPR39517.1 N-acetyltransferase [Apilactobacillus micheneri]